MLPGTYTDGLVVDQHWDGVNLFKHYPTKFDDMDERLQMCENEDEGDYSLSGVSMRVNDWPRGDGCHKPDTTLQAEVDGKDTVLTYSTELHAAYEQSHKFNKYSFDCGRAYRPRQRPTIFL